VKLARDAGDHRGFECFGRAEARQDAGQAGGEQRFTRAGRPDHQQIMRSARRDLERALGGLLSLDLREVRPPPRLFGLARNGGGQQRRAAQVGQQREQVGGGEDFDLPRPRRLGALRGGTDEPLARRRSMERGEQYPCRRRDPRVETELADHDIMAELLGIDDPHRGEQRQRDRQVEVRSFLGQVGGRQVGDDSLGRHRDAERRDRPAHSLAAFTDRLVGQSDNGEARLTGDQLDLHLDRARFEAEVGDGRDDSYHGVTPSGSAAARPQCRNANRPPSSARPRYAAPPRDTRLAASASSPHIPAMFTREKWRAYFDHPAVEMLLFIFGVLLIVASPIAGVIPGPGGIFVFAAGLALVLRTSMWAKRRYVHFKRWQPKVGAWADWGLRRRSAKRRAELEKARMAGEPAALGD